MVIAGVKGCGRWWHQDGADGVLFDKSGGMYGLRELETSLQLKTCI